MRLCVPVLLLVTFLWACDVWPQSLMPDNHYVLRGDAAYIAGYPYVPQSGKSRPQPVRGQVYLGMNSLQFRFCSSEKNDAPDPFAEGLATAVDQSRCAGCGAKSCMEVRIPYDRMKLLARGRVTGTGGTSEDLQVASAGLGIAGLVSSVATSGSTEKWLIGGTVGLIAVAFGVHVLSLKRANYLTLFYAPPHQADPSLPCNSKPLETASAATAKPAEPPQPRALNLFADANGCDVSVLQIFNMHDYWNMATILNARTGKEFVSQSAEQK
jgi:hypothetical protein